MNRKTISAVAVLALGATLAFAAPHDGKGGKEGWEKHRGGEFSERFAQKLNLTDTQKQQMKELDQSFRDANKAFFESAHQTRTAFKAAKEANDTAKLGSLRPTMDAQHAQMKQLRAAQDVKVRAILTAEQRVQLDAMKAEHEAHEAQHGEHKQQ
jgi:protein CpxP